MVTKLYVGGINYSTTDSGLTEAFSKAGQVVSASIIMDRETGRSKGFGFVEMATPEEAQAAIKMLNGQEIDGRAVSVSEAKPKEDRPKRNF
jgi:RNA recognition motif-containing protein